MRTYHSHQVSRKDGIYWHKIKVNHKSQFGKEEHKKEILTYNQDMKNYRTAKKEIKKEGGKIRKYRNKMIIYGGGSILSLVSLLTLLSLIPGVTTSGLTNYYCGETCEIPFTICTSKYDLDFRGDQIQPFYFEGNATLERIINNKNKENFSFNGNYLKKGNCWNLTAIVRKNEFETIKYGFEMGEINIDPFLFDPKKYKADLTYQIINESKNIKRINLDISDKTLLDIKNKIYQGELINLKKTKYFGNVDVKLMEKINVTKERVKKSWKCNCTNETINETLNGTKENKTIEKIIEVCETCYEYENYTVEEMREIDPETFILKKDTEIFEVEGASLKIVDLPNGKYGYSVFTNVSVLGINIEGATWWNSSWTYKKQINISNTAGDLTDYQVKIELNSSNFNYSHANTTGKDIRFTNSSDDEIDYWIELWNSLGSSYIWVEVPTLTNNTNTTIYLYYGNSAAPAVSSGTDTFQFFDDFNRANSATVGNGWSEYQVADGTALIEDNKLKISCTTTLDSRAYAHRDLTSLGLTDFVQEIDCNVSHLPGTNNDRTSFIIRDGDSTKNILIGEGHIGGQFVGYKLYYHDGSYNEIESANSNVWRKYGISYTLTNSEEAKAYFDNVYKAQMTGQTNYTNPFVVYIGAIAATSGETGTIYYDNFRVRKYASPEPTYTIGTEESSSGAPIISNKNPSTPITKEPQSSNFNISADIDQTANNHWEQDNGSGYVHLEWDNGTVSPVYLFSPTTEGTGNYTVKLTAINTTNSSLNSSTTWAIELASLSISSPSPSGNSTIYVRNRSMTYSATVSASSNNKWIDSISSEIFEWDNGTTSPSLTKWIDNSSMNSFNISLISYSVETGTNTSYNWTNPIIDNTFNENWTWERLHYFSNDKIISWSNFVCGDADNDGTEECLGSGRYQDYFYVIELNGSVRNITRNYDYVGGYKRDIYDVTGDGNYEIVFTGPNKAGNEAMIDLWQLNATSTVFNNEDNIVPVGSDNSHGIAWFNISGEQEFYSGHCGVGEIIRIKINSTAFSTSTIDTVANSGEDSLTLDIDNDGVDELIVSSGFSSGTAKVYVYEINYTTGAYISKTLILDKSLDDSTHFSAYIVGGDVDNDGINNLIVFWEHVATWGDTQARIEAYEFNASYGVGNHIEGFLIDSGSHLEDVEGGSNWAIIGDIDEDNLNEFVYGILSNLDLDPGAESYLHYWDIAENGTNITKHTIGNFTNWHGVGSPRVAPAFVNDSGTQKIGLALVGGGNPGYSDVFLLSYEEEAVTTIPPTSNSPPDASYTQNSAQTIGWILQDETSPGYYYVKRNGTIQNASTSWTNNTNLNVWVNTTTIGNNWNYTIFFNDSAGNDGTPDSVFINITGEPDTKFEIYNGNSWVEFNDTNDIEFRCTPTQTNCEPTNQNAAGSQSIFKITNNGTASGNVSMKINQTFSGIDFKCDDDYTSVGATIFTISYQQIHGTLANGSSIYISCWTDYNNPTSGGIFEVYTNILS